MEIKIEDRADVFRRILDKTTESEKLTQAIDEISSLFTLIEELSLDLSAARLRLESDRSMK